MHHNELVNRLQLVALSAAPIVLALAACSSSTNSGGKASPSPSAQGTGCVSEAEARKIWMQLDQKITAIELDPKHAGVSDIATGQAQQLINNYLQMQLVAANVTEKEVDKLESLTVVKAGCNGGDLQLRVTETVVQDDYLKPNGQLDHKDPAVGTTIHLLETFVRSAGGWKESDFQDLDQQQPTPTPQLF